MVFKKKQKHSQRGKKQPETFHTLDLYDPSKTSTALFYLRLTNNDPGKEERAGCAWSSWMMDLLEPNPGCAQTLQGHPRLSFGLYL